ncbi:MAG: DUF3795 domain-containing protein [Bacteroidetes bacterium]|nr:DUF3795 domain-containing protein [Bacteroidota bacterium]
MNLSVCGLICTDCPFYTNPCNGCYNVKGQTFWAQEATHEKICLLYDCAANKKGFNSCGECDDLPCKKFQELKDPNITDEEHIKSINDRVKNLQNN